MFVLQLEIPIATVKHILSFCKREGIITVLNPAPASKELVLTDPIFKCVDYLIPNETESQLLTSLTTDSREELMDALLTNQHMTVIMTIGGEGAFVGQANQVKIVLLSNF